MTDPDIFYGGTENELHPDHQKVIQAAVDRYEAGTATQADVVLLWFDVIFNIQGVENEQLLEKRDGLLAEVGGLRADRQAYIGSLTEARLDRDEAQAELAKIERRLLPHLVDVVWADAMGDGQVPSTNHARKLIAHAESTLDSEEEESHVLPFSVMMLDTEAGWEQYGVYATREEADAVVPKLLSKYGLECRGVRVADTRRVLRHQGPIMDFKGIAPQ